MQNNTRIRRSKKKSPADIGKKKIAQFDSSEFARLLGLNVIEAREGFARVFMPASGKQNPHGAVHGGAIFSLADQAFAIAGNAGGTDRVAVSIHIQYVAPAKGDLEAVAERIAQDGNFSMYRILVYEGARVVAQLDGLALQVSPQDA